MVDGDGRRVDLPIAGFGLSARQERQGGGVEGELVEVLQLFTYEVIDQAFQVSARVVGNFGVAEIERRGFGEGRYLCVAKETTVEELAFPPDADRFRVGFSVFRNACASA